MKKDQIEEGRMTEHSRGLGTVTREMVVKRARELAIINGRAPDNILQSDFDEARRELTGSGETAKDGPTNLDRRSHAELRETVRGTRGRQAPRVPAHDEQTDAEKLVEEGVSEAEHDQMVEGTKESLRRGME
jgi:hypothetical protein